MKTARQDDSRESRIARLEIICEILDYSISYKPDEYRLFKIVLEHISSANSLMVCWSIIYVWTGQLPTRETLHNFWELFREVGPDRWLQEVTDLPMKNLGKKFRIERDSIFVDVFHTSQTELATGIQRVTRETVKQWVSIHNPILVTWDPKGLFFRTLTSKEFTNATELPDSSQFPDSADDLPILIPLGSRMFFPELTAEPWRTNRLIAYIEATKTPSSAIGYDCVPITSAETTSPGMPVVFANYLDLLAHTKNIAAISAAAQTEFAGWRRMLSAKGITGPEVKEIFLASSATKPSASSIKEVLANLGIQSKTPLVVCVGSHEPRKNHLAVLRAAEHLWNKGYSFTLLFVGGNSWKSGYFKARVKSLQDSDYSLITLSAANDKTLLSLIASSQFTIFPSLNEGFGLPVAESLELGVPVITSNFGSTREISENFGGLLIDPKSDEELKNGMEKLLVDTNYLGTLKKQASRYKTKSWPTYAEQVWRFFTK